MKILVSILLMSFLVSTTETWAQRQGIYGEVFWLSGNNLPSPGKPNDPEQGISREIEFYEITHLQDAEQTADGFFTNVKTKLIATTLSAANGSFSIKLPPGEYSVFVKEPHGLFANLFDKNNRINPVIVKPKQYSWLTITVDYESAN